MSFQKDRRLSVSTKVPKNFARTPPPAFLFPDQRFQRPQPVKPAEPFNARSRRRRCLAPLIFRVNQFFLKNFLNTPEARRPQRRRPSKESQSPCQPGFSALPQTRKPRLPNPLRQARLQPQRPARFQASGGYTDTTPSPQASNDRNTNYLNEQESRTERRPARIHMSARALHIEGATRAGKILRQALRTWSQMRARQVTTHAGALFFHILIAAGCIAAWRAA